jgi:Fuc2NAc and GlcNAc transferase
LYFYGIISIDYIWYFLPAGLIGGIGFIDDRISLSVFPRLMGQSLAAIGLLFLLKEGGEVIQTYLSLPLPICFMLLTFSIVWMTNLYNFMDGSDGLAAMEAIFVFGLGGFFLFEYQATELGVLAWGLSALLSGFLAWNWPTARIFMGDSGSCFLGFMIASYAFISYKSFSFPWQLWLILSGLFWFDATATLLRRLIAKDKWYKPHRLHAYQRLIQKGWSHQKVLLSALLLNTFLGGLAFVAYLDPRLLYFSLGVAIFLLTFIYILIEIAKPMYRHWYEY